MTIHDRLWTIDAFVDGELDLGTRLELEARMQGDAALRQQVETLGALRDSVRGKARRHAAPPNLRARIAAMREAPRRTGMRPVAVPAPRHAPRTIAALAFPPWFGWPALSTLGIAAAIALVSNLVWMQPSEQTRLMDGAIDSHVRSTMGPHLVDVAGSDDRTVRPFLSARLGFSPSAGDLSVPGSELVGGRVDYLAGRPVAALVYRQGQHVVNAFVWPAGGSDSVPAFMSERGFRLAHWTQAGMSHCVVSDLDRQEFRQVVAAVQQVDATPR